MPHFGGPFYLGNVSSHFMVGNPAFPDHGGFGFGPFGQTWSYDIVPAAPVATAVCTNQGLTSGTALTLNGTLVSGGVAVFDVARNVTITGASATNLSGINFTIVGKDIYGKLLSQTIAGPNGAVAVSTTKAYKEVISVTPNGTNAAQVSVGSGPVLGLPFRLVSDRHVVAARWAAVAGFDTGTITAAVATDPSTATTGDVRGTYSPSSAPDGTRRLTLICYATNDQINSAETSLAPAFGVRQNLDT
jgi:hypothetical protein